jgi:hypothetical protein
MDNNLESIICSDIDKIINEIVIKHTFDKIYIVISDKIDRHIFDTLTELVKDNKKNVNIKILFFSSVQTLDFIEAIDNPNINVNLITITNNENEIEYFGELNDVIGFDSYYEINPNIKN